MRLLFALPSRTCTLCFAAWWGMCVQSPWRWFLRSFRFVCVVGDYEKSTQVFTRRQFTKQRGMSFDRTDGQQRLHTAEWRPNRWNERWKTDWCWVRLENEIWVRWRDVCSPSSERTSVHVPSSYCCPISMEIMVEPVIVATGHTYDKECIQTWLSQGNRTCPATGQKLRHLELVPNFALRNAIQVK